jgi:hypothetical protein
LLPEPFLGVAMFFLVPRFVLHKNVMLAQKLKILLDCGLQSRRVPGLKFAAFQAFTLDIRESIGRPFPSTRPHGHTTANWAILSAGTTFFQMPSWSIGGSADPAVPDGLDAVRQTVDPVPGSGGLIVGPLT